MPIKHIQLRGISRTPSDRSTADGGLAESLNMQLDTDEMSPMLQPKDVTADKGLPTDGRVYSILHIHKGTGYENIICQEGNKVGIYKRSLATKYDINLAQSEYWLSSSGSALSDILIYLNEYLEYEYNQFTDTELAEIESAFNASPRRLPTLKIDIPGEDADNCLAQINEWLTNVIDWEGVNTAGKRTYSVEQFTFMYFLTLASGEIINDIATVGNSIVVATNQHTHYALFKNQEYKYLGTQVPFPRINLGMNEMRVVEDDPSQASTQNYAIGEPFSYFKALTGPDDGWVYEDVPQEIKEHFENKEYLDVGSGGNQLLEKIKDAVNEASKATTDKGYYNHPIWVSYGIRLFDGTKINSTPVILSTFSNYPYVIWCARHYYSDNAIWTYYISIEWKNLFRIAWSEELKTDFEDWKDIVTSIDVYTSPMIGATLCNNTRSAEASFKKTITLPMSGGDNVDFWQYSPQPFDYNIKDDIKNNANLFLLKRYSVQEYSDIPANVRHEIDSMGKIRSEDLVTQETLQNPEFLRNEITFEKIHSINNRLVGIGSKVFIQNPAKMMSAIWEDVNYPYRYRDERGRPYVINIFGLRSLDGYPDRDRQRCGRDADGKYSLFDYGWYYDIQWIIEKDGQRYVSEPNDIATPFGQYTNRQALAGCMIICPYENAVAVRIGARDSSTDWQVALVEKELEPMNLFGSSYWYLDPIQDLHYIMAGHTGEFLPATTEPMNMEGKLYMSEIDSPFIFERSNAVTVHSKIIDVGVATKALSEGQLGAFPLYLFTTDGIYYCAINDQFNYNNPQILAREVAHDGSITPINQEIIFITDNGVKAISGSEIIDLSPNMNGKHYALEGEVAGLLSFNNIFGFFCRENDGALISGEPFMEFMNTASVLFDYTGNRLIFFTEDKDFHYVYNLVTKTWHKEQLYAASQGQPQVTLAQGYKLIKTLNSFPESLVVARSGNLGAHDILLDYNTILNVEDTTDMYGVIATRALTFEAPDVRKRINSIRIRGNYNPGDVQYILLGSMDGIHYGRLTSLRQGSYKYYRIILLTKLNSTERISWIDVDYDEVFNNKLR